ncbi:MAG: efflux RND transporter periplasmic adaptor subunit [Geminicoccaceae bacterium]|nr:efflux RND transporter periplasmic adaptor subunit [Geminicoccaceae bacterium]
MRSSYIIAAAFTLALAGWLSVPYLTGSARESPRETADASDTAPAGSGSSGVAGSGAAGSGTGEPDPMRVTTELSRAETIDRVLVLNGRSQAARRVVLRAEVEGRVVALPVAKGAAVEAGTVVAGIDERDRRARVAMAEALLAQRRIEYEGARKLATKGFQADMKVAESKALLQAAEAELDQARIALEQSTIEAPFAGVLEERPVELGDFVAVGDPLGEVIELDPLLVVADVPEARIAGVAVGSTAALRFAGHGTFDGRIRYVARAADPATRSFAVEIGIANADRSLPAGVSVEAILRLDRVAAHRISAALLALDDDGTLVVKAIGEGKSVVVYPIEIVRSEADAIWVAGLPDEVALVTVGQGFLVDGQKVEPVMRGEGAEAARLLAERG